MSSLREALEKLTYASDDGTEYEHTHPKHEGEAECPACWVLGIRQALAAHPAEPAPAVDRIVAEFVAQREEYVSVLKQCVEADADYHRWQGHAEARRQLRDKLAAGIFRDEVQP